VQEGRTGKLPDLALVLDSLDRNTGEHVHAYVDCVPEHDEHESKDWNYVTTVLYNLHASGFFHGYQRIYWWSDTGPNHFRTSNTIYMLRRFQQDTGIEMIVSFFAPNHGHSMCDGHIGAISKKLNSGARDLFGTLKKWDKQFVEMKIEELSFTHVTQHNIERQDKLVKTLKGITKYLVFTFDDSKPNTVTCRTMWGDSEPVEYQFTAVNANQK
jgi:hypothetical protein